MGSTPFFAMADLTRFSYKHIKTARRFDQADRLVVQLHNRDGSGFGAAAESNVDIDAYIRED